MLGKRLLFSLFLVQFFSVVYSQNVSENYNVTPDSIGVIVSENHDIVPFNEKLEYLKEKSLTDTVFNQEIPEDLSSFFELTVPVHQQVLIQPQLIIKGKNAYSSYTFLNTDRIRTRKDGDFYYEDQLDSIGSQPVYLTFVTPQNKFLSLKRTCIRLTSPPDFKDIKENRKTVIYFYNSRFFYDNEGEKKLIKPLTRAELAFFVYQYLNQGMYPKVQSFFKDVPNDKWYSDAINFCAEYGYMNGFLDGHFNPAKPVTLSDYIVTFSKIMLPKNEGKSYEIKSLPSTHWIIPRVNTLVSYGLLNPEDSLDLSREMSLLEFIHDVSQLPQVATEFQKLEEVTDADEYDQEDISMVEFIYNFMIQRDQTLASLRGISFDSLKENLYVFQDELTVSGVIFPIETFKINNRVVTPDIQGEFIATLSMNEGESVITIDALGETSTYNIVRLKGYENLEDHWFSKTAAKMRFLSLLPDTATYNCDHIILKEEVAAYIHDVDTLSMSSDVTLNVTENIAETVTEDAVEVTTNLLAIDDVPMDSPYYDDILFLVDNKIASLQDGYFYPKKEVLRAEAITMLVRSFYNDAPLAKGGDIPYWDVNKNHWAYESIRKAYQLNLISASPHFYPDKPITRAEFLTMLSRTQIIRDLFSETFNDD